jgi:hypothetical protein
MARRPASAAIGHNGGPPLKEPRHVPPWGRGGFKRFFEWRAARKKAWSASMEIARRRAEQAEAAGVSYETYVLELLERGRHLPAKERSERPGATKKK